MKLLLVFLSILFFSNMCDGPETSVPDAVKKAFKTHYPNAVNVEWEKEKKGFEAEFRDGDKKMEVLFDSEGNILKEELDEAVDDDKEENESEEVDDDDDEEEK